MNQVALFDLDNTMTDRPRSIRAFAQRFLEHFGPALGEEIPLETLDIIMQEGDQLGYRPKSYMFVDLYARLPWTINLTVETIADFWYAESSACMQPRDGLHTLLEKLVQAGWKVGVITNGETTVQNKTLDALNIRPYLQTVLISEEVNMEKPGAEIFHAALNALSSDKGWYVGDHPENDIIGAARAGLTPIWLRTSGHPWPADHALPLYQIEQLCEIPSILKLP